MNYCNFLYMHKKTPWINVQDTGLSLSNSLLVIAYSDCDKGGGGSSICTKIVVKIMKCLKKRRQAGYLFVIRIIMDKIFT